MFSQTTCRTRVSVCSQHFANEAATNIAFGPTQRCMGVGNKPRTLAREEVGSWRREQSSRFLGYTIQESGCCVQRNQVPGKEPGPETFARGMLSIEAQVYSQGVGGVK